MTEGLQEQLAKDPSGPPADLDPKADWNALRSGLIDDFRSLLWPAWDNTSQVWSGPAVDTMAAITKFDLQMMSTLRPTIRSPPASVPNPKPGTQLPKQSAFFASEDNDPFLAMLDLYDFEVTAAIKQDLIDLFDRIADKKYGTVVLQLKVVFQRPRPNQVTFLTHSANVTPKRSITAATPALPSGHSIQALLGIGAVIESIFDHAPTPHCVAALAQLAVDIGDRRVLAGLHYPSDAIAAWIVVSRLSGHVFRDGRVGPVLIDAIKRGQVFKALAGAGNYDRALGLI